MRAWAHALALCVAGLACDVSSDGLDPTPPDGSIGGNGGGAVCPAGMVDQAGWPARFAATSCTRWCGPDELGMQTCRQSDRATCQAASGCLCRERDVACVACGPCEFLKLPECYLPTNAAAAPACPAGVARGEGCGPACGRSLCRLPDGKSACVCNREGKYACAEWDGSSWR